jgi:hypothetical protein
LVGKLYLKVLKTPDHLCALGKIDDPQNTVELRKLEDIYQEHILYNTGELVSSCFHPEVKKVLEYEGLLVRGEVGKFLNAQKDLNPLHPYSSDRAAFGIWIDKLLAMKFLTQRFNELPVSSGYKNFWDFSPLNLEIKNLIDHMILGEPLTEALPFINKQGERYEDNLSYQLNLDNTLISSDLPYEGLRSLFEISKIGNPKLNEILLKNAKKWEIIFGGETLSSSRENVNYFTVRKKDKDETLSLEGFKVLKTDEIVYLANQKNGLAYNLMSSIENLDYLKELDKSEIEAVIKNRESPAILGTLSELELTVMEYPLEMFEGLYIWEDLDHKITATFLIDNFGFSPEDGQVIEDIFQELGREKIKRVFEIFASFDTPPENASEQTKRLYAMEITTLKDFISGGLEQVIERFKTTIPLLPEHINAL